MQLPSEESDGDDNLDDSLSVECVSLKSEPVSFEPAPRRPLMRSRRIRHVGRSDASSCATESIHVSGIESGVRIIYHP